MNYSEAINYIHRMDWRKSKLGLDRTRELLRLLDDPHESLRFVHVAGTNGKGSTSAMLASVMHAAGYRTGLYTSPYIHRFNERMRIDGAPISDCELSEIITRVAEAADSMGDHPTEFEMGTAAAFCYFLKNSCDIVVLEVGLGGLLDSTNVIGTPEAAVITAIGLDHTKELGGTISEIAGNKAGIIKPGGAVVFYGEDEEALPVIYRACADMNAMLFIPGFQLIKKLSGGIWGQSFDYGDHKGLKIPLLGEHQLKNAAVALTALDVLSAKGWEIPEAAVAEGLCSVSWPGRFEVLCEAPVFIVDGGHNRQGANAAAKCFDEVFPGESAVFLLGILEDKDVEGIIDEVTPFAKGFVAVRPDSPRALPAEKLGERLSGRGLPVTVCPSIGEGIRRAVEAAGAGPVVALGSLYMVGEIRDHFLKSIRDDKLYFGLI